MTRINIDTKDLAKCLGYEMWPSTELIDSDSKAMAARAICDAHNSADPHNAILGAEYWIRRAHAEGKKEGTEKERIIWRNKIMKIFEVEL